MKAANTATNNITTIRGKEVLCAAREVSTESLPRCLRHTSPRHALEEAGHLIMFLDEVNGLCQTAEFHSVPPNYNRLLRGMGQVLDLLQDKVEIGGQYYAFPSMATGSAPALFDRIDY